MTNRWSFTKGESKIGSVKLLKKVWEKQDALVDAILLAFDLPLKYDYVIPPEYDIGTLVRVYLKETKVPKNFQYIIQEVVCAFSDEHSVLESYLKGSEEKFGREWFYGYGTLSRWRYGEKEKAEKRVDKYLTESQKENIKKLQAAIKIKDTPVAFEPMSANIARV